MKKTTSIQPTQASNSMFTPATMQNRKDRRNKQNGFSTMDFIFWMVFAALALAALIGLYTTGSAASKKSATGVDVVQIKAAVEGWRGARTNLTGIDISKLCAVGYGNTSAPWCGNAADGKLANPYGGNYSVQVSSNVSQINITISGVDAEYVTSVANSLASMSADRCASIEDCTTTTVAGTNISVTM